MYGCGRGATSAIRDHPSPAPDPTSRLRSIPLASGATHLRARERIRRHLHLARPTPAQPRRGRRYLFRRVVSWGRSSNVFLENGARLYLDVGSHPEYATPECDSIDDLVVHDKAGERILEGLVQSAEQRLREEGIRGEVFLFKNNTDSAGNSYGCHENYLVEREGDFSKFTDVLIPFLVTRQVYAGAGKVLQTARGGDVLHRPAGRAHLGRRVVGDDPLAADHQHARRAHADAERFRRLHVIVGDSNMSEYATFLKVGATSIILRMLEEDGPLA